MASVNVPRVLVTSVIDKIELVHTIATNKLIPAYIETALKKYAKLTGETKGKLNLI